jgi:saccharopine dehydrogenase-like NADP-dependent oxidoreductase
MNKVLILGAGMVVKPMVEYLMKNDIRIIIASPMKGRADELIGGHALGSSVDWSMDDRETLQLMVRESDLTVSLLPYKYHTDVARICLASGKSLVTTSYVQKDMIPLDEDAKRAGILFLNEVGLDPGLDHMSAMRIIDHIHSKGGKVEEFYSICGALPAPEAADNPMRYKFSWSPKGVVLAGLNSARFLLKGKEVFIETEDLFRNTFTMEFPETGQLDVYPNRDSLSYADIYGIPEAKTIYRGTYRYKGWCETLDAMKKLRMLSDEIKDYSGMTYAGFLKERMGGKTGNLRKNVMKLLKVPEDSAAIRSFEFLGFFSDEPLNYYETTPFEITSDRMIDKMMLKDNERDMVILQHVFLASWPDGKKEVIKSFMIDYGTPASNTAIARTVALPASIAVKLIMEGKINAIGVHRPVIPDIYNPLLDELKELGIVMKEEYGLPDEEMRKLKG